MNREKNMRNTRVWRETKIREKNPNTLGRRRRRRVGIVWVFSGFMLFRTKFSENLWCVHFASARILFFRFSRSYAPRSVTKPLEYGACSIRIARARAHSGYFFICSVCFDFRHFAQRKRVTATTNDQNWLCIYRHREREIILKLRLRITALNDSIQAISTRKYTVYLCFFLTLRFVSVINKTKLQCFKTRKQIHFGRCRNGFCKTRHVRIMLEKWAFCKCAGSVRALSPLH